RSPERAFGNVPVIVPAAALCALAGRLKATANAHTSPVTRRATRHVKVSMTHLVNDTHPRAGTSGWRRTSAPVHARPHHADTSEAEARRIQARGGARAG